MTPLPPQPESYTPEEYFAMAERAAFFEALHELGLVNYAALETQERTSREAYVDVVEQAQVKEQAEREPVEGEVPAMQRMKDEQRAIDAAEAEAIVEDERG